MDNQSANRDNEYEELRDRIQMGDVKAALRDMHPADIADVLSDLSEENLGEVFKHLDSRKAGTVLDEVSPEVQKDIIETIDEHKLADIINDLPPDEQADIMGAVDDEKRDRIMSRLDEESTSDIEELLQYQADTAAGVMTTDFIALPPETSVKAAIAACRREARENLDRFLYVVDRKHRLIGLVGDRKLLTAPENKKLEDIMSTDIQSVQARADRQEAAQIFRKYDLITLPVVDEKNVLKGVITVDDILEVIRDENSEDIYRMAGSGEKDPFHESMLQKSSKRLPWLFITLVGEMVAAMIMQKYGSGLNNFLKMAFFIPVIIAIAGNVAIQTATIIVRGLALGEAKKYRLLSHFMREVGVGLMVGLVCSIICGWGAGIILHDLTFGVTVGISMMCAITVASFNGVIIPLFCNAIGIDPAIVSGPFITTFNDVLGIIIYLCIGYILL